LRSSYGLHAPFALRTIVELKTDSGLTGIAETYGGDGPLAGPGIDSAPRGGHGPLPAGRPAARPQPEAAAEIAAADRSQTYLVPGENPADRHARTFAAIEIACLDLIGKAVGKPVCDVIGGRVRDAVSFSAYLFYKHGGGGGVGDDAREDEYGEILDPKACVRSCKQMIAQYGFKEIKLKGGVLDPDVEMASIQALREEFGAATRCASIPIARGVSTLGGGGPHVEGRAIERRVPGGSLRGSLWNGRSTATAAGGGNDTPQASNVAVTASPMSPKPASWMRCRSCSPILTTGAACGTCSSFRT
jgi:glucarate dehydratase